MWQLIGKYSSELLLNASKQRVLQPKILRQIFSGSKKFKNLSKPLWNGTCNVSTSHGLSQLGAEAQIKQQPYTSIKQENIKAGDVLHGFQVLEVEEIPEFQLSAIRLIHVKSGGEYLHIERNDGNNAFAVGFRTTPTDSTGLPHILEHTTLCGSHKYPCRDPFFKMLNRSLATYMNACTGADFTMYPFSTQNKKDYQNLMSIYLDAVFKPNLRLNDFKQEGWRLEHEDPNDATSPVIIKGVVFNEMKGVFSENQNIFMEALQNHILPSNTYGVCSGGDPLKIPHLTYGDLKKFHETYYSPSNTKYYSYGNFPFQDHLKYINETYLSGAIMNRDVKKSTEVPHEKRWKEAVRKHITCRPDPLAADQTKTSSIAVSYLCSSITDIDEVFTLQILSELLIKGPNSAFYKSLVETNIGSGFSPATGYGAQTKDTVFTVGLQGVAEKDFEVVLKAVDKTIEDVIENGFDGKHLEGILHSIELNTKHQSSDFGLSLLFNIVSLWTHDGNLVKGLKVEQQVKDFKNRLKNDPDYLKKKVKEYFKDNEHKLILTMSPDPEFEIKLKSKEDELLQEKLKTLSDNDFKDIYKNGLELLQQQGEEQDTSCLPMLRTKDLSKTAEILKYEDVKLKGVPFQILEQPTNGITYFRGIININTVSDDLKVLVPLFAHVVTKMGTKKHTYKEFDQMTRLKTGGLNFSTHVKDAVNNSKFEEALALGSFCLDRNVEDMFDLWSEIINEVDLSNEKRFETLVKVNAANLVNGLADSGHLYAMASSASVVSEACSLKEKFGGLTYVNEMKKSTSDVGGVLRKIEQILESSLKKKKFRCALNILEGNRSVIGVSEKFIESISGGEDREIYNETKLEKQTKGLYYIFPMNVNYTSKSVAAVPYGHPDYAPLRILSRYVTMKYLLHEIREKGGAYGAGLSVSPSGVLSFYSYRDPNPINSFHVYDDIVTWLKKQKIKEEDVEEGKLGVFQSVDSPTPPGSKGLRRFMFGIDDEMFMKHRLELMAVTKEQLIEVACKYLDPNLVAGRSILGPENKELLDVGSHKWNVV